MKTASLTTVCLLAVLVDTVNSIDALPFLNVVDITKTCNLDTDCGVSDLSYIVGNGKPRSP